MSKSKQKSVMKIELEPLLTRLGVLERKRVVIEINNLPDHDISNYRGAETADYFFRQSWNFSSMFDMVFDLRFMQNRILSDDDLSEIRRKFRIGSDTSVKLLQELFDRNENVFNEYGFEVDSLDDFRLKAIRLAYIDNANRRAWYEGAFTGDNASIDPMTWRIYSLVDVVGTPTFIETVWKAILGESFMLHRRGDYRLSHFLAYTAFESFVNASLEWSEESIRLKESVNELFAARFSSLDKHQLYTSTIHQIDEFKSRRNDVAHGSSVGRVSQLESREALEFVLVLVMSYEFKLRTFEELQRLI